MRRVAILWCVFLLSGCANVTSTPQPKFFTPQNVGPNLDVDSATFGIIHDNADGTAYLEESATVPLNQPGTPYGWRIHLITNRTVVKWREVFELPVAPAEWGKPGQPKTPGVSEDGKTCTTEEKVPLDKGWIDHSWSVASGDPKGEYKITIYIDDVKAREFVFKAE